MSTSTARTTLAAITGVFLLLAVLVIGVPMAALGVSPDPGVCGPGGTAQTVVDQQLDAEQMANATTIVSVAAGRGLPPRTAIIALATATRSRSSSTISTPPTAPPASACSRR